jgi:glutathione S-transferase
VNNRTKRTSEGEDFLTINPKGYVAALQLKRGGVLTEGPAIVQYLADLEPRAGLAPANGTLERAQLHEWLNFIASEIHTGSVPLFNKELLGKVQDLFKSKLIDRFDLIEAALTDRDYLLGPDFTVADAYLFAVMGWMHKFSIDLTRWPQIAGYMQRIGARASVQSALAREAIIQAC